LSAVYLNFCKYFYKNITYLLIYFFNKTRYFACYDQNRDQLLAAYHPKALYSISLNLNSDAAVKSAKFDDNSFRDSRNLKKVNDKGKLTFMKTRYIT